MPKRSTARALLTFTGLVCGWEVAASSKREREMLALLGAKVTLVEAIAIAEKDIPGGRVIDADVASAGGRMSYAIEILTDRLQVVRVDLHHGAVLSKSLKRVPSKAWKELAAAAEAKVLLADAIAIAEKAVPAGKLLSAEVSNRGGVMGYVVHMAKDAAVSAVHVDFNEGRILGISEKLDD
jgi:uncharacterized membrane protein YkoI